jgi:FKBP12-rapamycin complex-associated protein
MWCEGIQDAWASYQEQKIMQSRKRLEQLYEAFRAKPQSLSEVSFHQQFGALLAEAEQWLVHYDRTTNEIAIHQAFEIYYKVYLVISKQLESLKAVYLENVSPRLLATKNCEIAVPGLYKPNKPIVRIACFHPELQVLQSKQHPRKILVYGSDNKEYHFLLKGREDLR